AIGEGHLGFERGIAPAVEDFTGMDPGNSRHGLAVSLRRREFGERLTTDDADHADSRGSDLDEVKGHALPMATFLMSAFSTSTYTCVRSTRFSPRPDPRESA